MPEPLKYSEAMGSPEAHLSVLKTRVDSAKEDYERAKKKGFQAQIQSTEQAWKAREQEYENFMKGNPGENMVEKENTEQTMH